jgi:hypothetical protein
MHFSIFAKMQNSRENGTILAKIREKFRENENVRENLTKKKNPLNLKVIRHAWYM